MIEGTDQNVDEIEKAFCSYLDNGWDWRSIQQDIVKAHNTSQPFPHYKYSKQYRGNNPNLIKQGRFYYNRCLKLISKLNTVTHDIDSGTFTRKQNEYWCEQVASFTLEQLVDTLYDKLGQAIDHMKYPKKRVIGLLKYQLIDLSIDEVLFMIEAAVRNCQDGKQFDFKCFRDYYPTAKGYLEEISNNCKYSGGDHYVKRKRELFS